MRPRKGDVIYWVASSGPDGKERVAMHFHQCLTRDCPDGMRGDPQCSPVRFNSPTFTATYSPCDFEYEDGTPVRF